MAPPRIQHKRGDTFQRHVALVRGTAAEPTTGWTITSQVRDKDDALVATCNIGNRTDSAGTFTVTAADTTAWPVGTLYWDIQTVNADGVIVSTETVLIDCLRDQTRA